MEIKPKQGFEGLKENWQSDLIAAISVALVALPLALGIALASGVPPVAGLLSAIIGGVVTTFFRGSHVGINGPAAALIVVMLGSIKLLDDGSGQALNYVFAAVVISGAIQTVMGVLKLGRFADIFHPSVIRGILAAIGIIIIAKQIHVALGTQLTSDGIIQSLIDAFKHLEQANPFVAVIAVLGILLLMYHSRISYKFFHLLPTPMWVLVCSIPFVYAFNFFEDHSITFFGNEYALGPHLLISVPDNLLEAIAFPNFSKMGTLPFWTSVTSITLVASIASLASSKAVDKLDPYKRKTNLNKDLVGIGVSTMACGLLGGLPITTVIIRSTVNVHNNAKTKWSNLYHGIILLAIVLIFGPLIQLIPLSALATILVFTGFKLASPKVFSQVYENGIEQLIYFTGTLLITLFTDILVGLFGGLLLAWGTHFLLVKMPLTSFIKMNFDSKSNLVTKSDGSYVLKVRGIANFFTMVSIDKLIAKIKPATSVKIDFSNTKLVDYAILENVYDFQRTHTYTGGEVTISGLDRHISSSTNKLALKIFTKAPNPLTGRQVKLMELAKSNQLIFEGSHNDDIGYFETFYYFKTRPVEYKFNRMYTPKENVYWEIADVTFEEGAYMSSEEFETTLGLIKFPFKIPKFTIEKVSVFGKYLDIYGHRDIDYQLYYEFSNKFLVKVEDEIEMDRFLNIGLKKLIENGNINHIESNGEAILIFSDHLRLAPMSEYYKMIDFIGELKATVK